MCILCIVYGVQIFFYFQVAKSGLGQAQPAAHKGNNVGGRVASAPVVATDCNEYDDV